MLQILEMDDGASAQIESGLTMTDAALPHYIAPIVDEQPVFMFMQNGYFMWWMHSVRS